MDFTRLKKYRFDPPGFWRWSSRFSLDELKEIYLKLFGYNWFELNPDRVFKSIGIYHVGKDANYGEVRLEDGGMRRLESCTIEELDWFLLVGESFLVDDPSMPWQIRFEVRTTNPLFGKVSREEALIALDLVGECGISY
jgi:hypothetical protein